MQSPLRGLIPALVLLALPASGCAPDGGTDSVRRDSAGATIVSHRSAADRPLGWTLTEVARIGRALGEGPDALYRIDRRSLAFHRDSGLYVLDRGNHRVVRFDLRGELLGSFAHEGEAEGELTYPVALDLFSDDGTAVLEVTDFARQKFVRFDLDGDLLEEPDIENLSRLSQELRRTDDALIFESRRGHRQAFYGGVDSVSELLLRVRDGDTAELARIDRRAPERASYESCRFRIAQGPFYQRRLVWGAGGPRVAVNDGVAYRIDVFGAEGLRTSIRRPLKPRPLTREDLAEVLGPTLTYRIGERPCELPLEEVLEARGMASRLQVLEELVVSPEGAVWARRRVLHPDSAGPIDVFDESGLYRGTLPPTAPLPALFLPGDRVAAVESDELDVPYVVVYRIRR